MFWQIVGALTLLSGIIEMHRVETTPPVIGTKIQAIIGRTIGDFLWIVSITWIVSIIIKLF